MVLTADKGVSMVVVDKEDYIKKSEELLLQPTYKILPSDPTTKHKNKLTFSSDHKKPGLKLAKVCLPTKNIFYF